jgi:hypothetical protein
MKGIIIAATWYELIEKELQNKTKAQTYAILHHGDVEVSRWMALDYFTRAKASCKHDHQNTKEKTEFVA